MASNKITVSTCRETEAELLRRQIWGLIDPFLHFTSCTLESRILGSWNIDGACLMVCTQCLQSFRHFRYISSKNVLKMSGNLCLEHRRNLSWDNKSGSYQFRGGVAKIPSLGET